jgi:hypothetical protein
VKAALRLKPFEPGHINELPEKDMDSLEADYKTIWCSLFNHST